MKKFLMKLGVMIVGALAILGLNFKDANAFVVNNGQISESTPLYLQDSGSILNQSNTNWHNSHSSHWSHESHRSHYSHYSSR